MIKATSTACLTARGRQSNRTIRRGGGKREDLGFYVRSGWEANYARYLKWLVSIRHIARWEYEPETFEFPVKRGSRFYTPDFKITNLDGTIEFHEVKGWMDQASRTRIDGCSPRPGNKLRVQKAAPPVTHCNCLSNQGQNCEPALELRFLSQFSC